MRPLLSAIGLSRLAPGDLDFLAGPGPRSLALPGFGSAGIQICYEIIFPGRVVDPRHRPDFLFNASNDAWFGSWGPPQHLTRSEEHTSELQSLMRISYAVFCLKNKKTIRNTRE